MKISESTPVILGDLEYDVAPAGVGEPVLAQIIIHAIIALLTIDGDGAVDGKDAL